MYKLQLKDCEGALGLDAKDIADRLGIKERKYATWEREEVALTLEDAYNLSIVLGCTPNDCADGMKTIRGRIKAKVYHRRKVRLWGAIGRVRRNGSKT